MTGARPIPEAPDAENAVLGDALLGACPAERLEPGHFYHPRRRQIAEAIIATARAGEKVDPITVAERLDNVTAGDLLDIEERWATAAWRTHLAILERYHHARLLIRAGADLVDQGHALPADIATDPADTAAQLRELARHLDTLADELAPRLAVA